MRLLEPMTRDLRYAFRMLRKTPGFTFIVLVTLAVGIGVNTAVFSVVNALLLKPLPYPDPARLATIRVSGQTTRGSDILRDGGLDGATFLALRDNVQLVDIAVRGPGGWGGGVNMIAADRAASVIQVRVSAGYFGVLGVRPMFGREFSADEDRTGGVPVAILSYDLWTRAFGSDPSIVDKPMMLRGESFTVIGVMPKDLVDSERADVWTPLRPSRTGEGGGTNYTLIARLRPGVEWTKASAEIDQIATPVYRPQFGPDVATLTSSLIPLQAVATSAIRTPLLMVWGAVGLVLLIACVNIAGLLLARLGARSREIATRMALGSGRNAVVRQLLVESAVLSVLGGLGGLGLGWLVLKALTSLSADVFDLGSPIVLDGRVLAGTLGTALATGVFFGLMPAVHASRVDVKGAMAESGTRSVAGDVRRWPRRVLVTAEVAMGVVLLVSAGLLVRSFVQLKSLRPGFDPTNVITAKVSLQDARYVQPARVAQLFEGSLVRIRRHPGVETAGVTLGLPYTRLLNLGFKPLDGNVDPRKGTIANVSYITPGYFEALKVRLTDGRLFSSADQDGSGLVAIVNQEFAKRYYDGGVALGRHIRVVGAREIVGVVENTRTTTSGFTGYNAPLVTPPIIYVPATQVPADTFKLVHTWFSPSWVVRARGPVEGIAAGIREAIASVDPLLPISKIETMADVQSASLSSQRFMASLVLGLGAVALLLSALGIHGLMSSSVTERTREIGIRIALGASSAQVFNAVVLPGLAMAGAGVVIGGGAALAVTRLMSSFIWGVTPTDPWTFISVALTLLVVAFLASSVPALRALRLDPALTLRAE
jgi:putative ABC transport system permease protein